MSEFYNRDGQPIDINEWARLRETGQGRVAHNRIWWRNRRVSTVWLGMNHGWFGEDIQIFETMVFKGKSYEDVYCKRYATEAEAIAGHKAVLRKLRWGMKLSGYHAL